MPLKFVTFFHIEKKATLTPPLGGVKSCIHEKKLEYGRECSLESTCWVSIDFEMVNKSWSSYWRPTVICSIEVGNVDKQVHTKPLEVSEKYVC